METNVCWMLLSNQTFLNLNTQSGMGRVIMGRGMQWVARGNIQQISLQRETAFTRVAQVASPV